MSDSIKNFLRFLSIGILFFNMSCGTSKVDLFSIGDSTMAEYDIDKLNKNYGGVDYPLRGWGMAFTPFFKDNVSYVNGGRSGYSSKSYVSRGSWDEIIAQVGKGDYVIIQFGHNDQKKDDPKRYTAPGGEFNENLIRYIEEVRALKAHPILATSIARRVFDDNGILVDTHGDYIVEVRKIASELGLPILDLNKRTMEYIQELGPEKSKAMFMHIAPNLFTEFPDGKEDNTHLSISGAEVVSKMAAEEILASKSKLKYFVDKKQVRR